MKFIPALLLLWLTAFSANAQMLENIDFEEGSNNINTYLTGINNNGFVTGYVSQLSVESGFIITNTGRPLFILPTDLGTTNVRVEGINDNNVAIVVGQTGNNTTVYKCYLNLAKDTISHMVQVTMNQPNALPIDINNKNDISGWYAGSQNFLFVKHDSIVPNGNNAWEARRVPDILPNYFNTTGGGINDANKVSGWYVDGINQAAMVYDNLAHTFNQLNSIYRIRAWDINNNGIICGEYRQTNNNNTWMAFYATPGNGTILNFNSLLSIFQSGTIQSIATGINDNMDIVGSYLNPNTNRWCGFIYHPNIPEYRVPGGFNVTGNTWGMVNNHQGTNPIWTQGYWQGASYATQDPYANNGIPLLDGIIGTTYNLSSVADSNSPTWKGYAKEHDITGAGTSTVANEQNYYKTIVKPKIFDKWYGVKSNAFKGYCYGFTTSSLLRYFSDASFSSWFGLPAGSNISQFPNTDFDAVQAVERCQQKWSDKKILKKNSNYVGLWEGLYRVKWQMRQSLQTTNTTPVNINTTSGSAWHSVLPYKIRTPRTLPFTQRDTVFLYDPNYPGDSTQHIKLGSIYFNVVNNAQAMSSTAYPGLSYLNFEFAGIRDIMQVPHAQMKSTAAPTYEEMYTFSLMDECYYTIKMNGLTEALVDGNGYTNDSFRLSPVFRYNTSEPISQHALDTIGAVDITTYNYSKGFMAWNQSNSSRSMGISRVAQLNETDHSTQKHALITYGNPDNISKTLAAYLRETEEDMQQGANIMVSNLCADPGDSIVTRSPAPYQYSVTKVNGTNSCTYHLDIYAAYNGAIQEFHADAVISPNSSHTIDPYFNGTNGTQIAVIVDEGMDGTPDDTLFVTGWPVGTGAPLRNMDIRVYPNPVTDVLQLELGSTHDIYTLSITDMIGKSVYTGTIAAKDSRAEIPMAHLPAGIYLLKLNDAKGNPAYIDKIMKQ
ncbi:MAG: T9SS type A sorting domain-containing protein [Flavipsychrobacter sp.]|nr:T9SS type A sorting domain-containing protein [Flavipsychrobacter sp.]